MGNKKKGKEKKENLFEKYGDKYKEPKKKLHNSKKDAEDEVKRSKKMEQVRRDFNTMSGKSGISTRNLILKKTKLKKGESYDKDN